MIRNLAKTSSEGNFDMASHRSLLDISAAANRLGCSERFVRRLVQERRVPFVKLAGTKVRFDEIELDLWLDAQRVEAVR